MKKAKDGVTEAIKKQKEKRAAMYARADARKESEMSKRRAKGLTASEKQSPNAAQQKSADEYYKKLASSPSSSSSDKAVKKDGLAEYMKTVKSESFGIGKKSNVKPSKENTPSSSKPGIRAKVPISSSRVSSNLSIPKRKTVDVTYKPNKKSKPSTQKKMIPLVEKVKKGENVAASQMKLKALQDKRRTEKMRAERKENRTAKKSNRTEKRSAVKAVKKSYKK